MVPVTILDFHGRLPRTIGRLARNQHAIRVGVVPLDPDGPGGAVAAISNGGPIALFPWIADSLARDLARDRHRGYVARNRPFGIRRIRTVLFLLGLLANERQGAD